MTQKGRKNHYNVKLLRGYGVAIHLKDNKVILKNGKDILSGLSETEEWFITKLPYEKIVVSGRGYISTEAIKLLCENNKNVILTDTYGHPISFINGMMESLTGTRYRKAQYDAFSDPAKRDYLSKQIIQAKLESQIRFLESTENSDVFSGITILKSYLRNIDGFTEAKASRIYFREFAKLIPERYGFESRNQSSQRITKRHASDVINGLLNYGYSVLSGEISKFVCGFGLDPYYGFMHRSHTGFQPLVYDIMEPFRWLVEYSAYKLAITHNPKQKIYKKDFAFTKDGNVVLDTSLIKRFLEILERAFQKERPYKFKHGRKTKDGMKSCQEITIAKIQIENLLNNIT